MAWIFDVVLDVAVAVVVADGDAVVHLWPVFLKILFENRSQQA